MRIVPIEYALNRELAEDVYDMQGRILLRKSTQLTDKWLDKLKNAGISSLYINDKYSCNILKPPLSTELKNEMVRTLQNIYAAVIRSIRNKERIREENLPAIDKMLELAGHAVYEIVNSPKQYITLTDIKFQEIYTASHSVNVAVLSLLLGVDYGVDHSLHRDLFVGALFHDIGMCGIDEKIFIKNGKLDVAEFLTIKKHPLIGHQIFKEFTFASAYMKNIVLKHHEKIDGSGYPKELRGQEIGVLEKIVAIADVYDAMTSDRVYARATTPYHALKHITDYSRIHFDSHLVDLFIRKVVPYPEGSIVRLSDHTSALVIGVVENDPIRPVVLPINAEKQQLETVPINLSQTEGLCIIAMHYDIG